MRRESTIRRGSVRAAWLLGALVLGALLLPALGFSGAGEADDAAAAAAWRARLTDDDVTVRRFAAWRIGQLPIDPADLSGLGSCLTDPDPLVARYCGDALVRSGPAAAESLVDRLAGGKLRGAAVDRLLGRLGKASVPPLRRLLESSGDRGTQIRAATILGEIGPAAESAVPALIRRLSEATRQSEAQRFGIALGRIGEPSLGPLLQLLERDSEPPRSAVHSALASIGPPARAAAPALIAALEHPDSSRVRFTAATALGAIGAKEAVDPLIRRLETDESDSVRAHAAEALGSIGEEPEKSVEALVRALRDDRPTVVQRAATAAGRFGEPAVPALVAATKVRETKVREAALNALRSSAAESPALLHAALARLDDPERAVADAAMAVLVDRARAAEPSLIAALEDSESEKVRGYAALILGKAESVSPATVPPLSAALSDEIVRVRQIAAWSLGMRGSAAEQAGTELIAALRDDPDATVRRNAAWALGSIGDADPDILASLQRAREDPSEDVRTEAEEAIEKLQGIYRYDGDDS